MPAHYFPSYAFLAPFESLEQEDYRELPFGHVALVSNVHLFKTKLTCQVRGTANVTSMMQWLKDTKELKMGRFVLYMDHLNQDCLCQIFSPVTITSPSDLNGNKYTNNIEVSFDIKVFA